MPTPTAQELLDQAKTLMLDLLTNRVTSGSLGSRQFSYHNLSTLQDVIDKLQKMVDTDAARSAGSYRPAKARFGSTSP